MKKSNQILIVSLVLILFMSMSTISATDLNKHDALNTNSRDNSLSIVDTHTNTKTITDNTKITTSESSSDNHKNTMSFTDLKNKMSTTQTIDLQSDVSYKAGDQTIGIPRNRKVIINGNGHTIDAKGKIKIFTVAIGAQLILKNVNIKNGFGGAILSSGTIKITNCNFTNCKSKTNGGAIAGSGKGSVVKCNFNKCSAKIRGGAISSNKLKIKNSNFNNNVAKFGGAIGGTAYLYNCNFKNCKATASDNYDGGGAGSGWFPKVQNCTFINCKAPKAYGGALRGTTNSYNCKYINCISKQGGAIRGKGDSISCTFEKCVATKNMGGAIYTGHSNINKCVFIKCSSKTYGAAIYAVTNVKISNCKYSKCHSGKGKAIYGKYTSKKPA